MTGGRWGRFFASLGAVPATARNFYRLLRSDEPVLLFPGGPVEVCRRRGQKNLLRWRDATDFVRPAARLDAIIVPFSSVGADDAVDLIIDGQEMQQLPVLGPSLTKLLEDNNFDPEQYVPERNGLCLCCFLVSLGLQHLTIVVVLIAAFLHSVMPLGTPPKPGRFRFEFHAPISTKGIDSDDATACASLYRDIKSTVQAGMTRLSSSPSAPAGAKTERKFLSSTLLPLPSLRAAMASRLTGLLDDLLAL
jgi:hypothetical protein